jgi:hypothetical protein
MRAGIRNMSPWAAVTGVVLVLGWHSAAFAKGVRISVGDDPSMKEGSPELVLIEVSDFQ